MSRNSVYTVSASLAVAACALAAPLPAQKAGTVEIGGFGRYTWLDPAYHLKDRFGGGGRIGLFVVRNLELEGAAAFTSTEVVPGGNSVSYIPVNARLVYNIPAHDRFAVLVGAGVVTNLFRKEAKADDRGLNGLLGLRIGLSDILSLRIDGLIDYMPTDFLGDNSSDLLEGFRTDDFTRSFSTQAGLSARFPKPRRDEDNDGVVDANDRCPGTPMGELVDATGCPRDSDADGVVDSRDRCPSTPQREIVDANGCPRDSDNDGVTDARDQCPNTVAGDPVDANGCARDADGDTVGDSRDRCPNTPPGTAVDANGCALDRDGDAVPDSRDRCPNTPRGATVDSDGCPLDRDSDGVPDGIDRCPNTSAGTQVDATGCPILFEEEQTTLVLEGVTFASGSAALTQNARTILDDVAQSLIARSEVRVEIGGHTDNTGSRTLNINLSQMRADAVRAYLVQRGVAMNRLTTRGYGPDNPIASNATASGRAQNRRVELRRIDR